MEKRTHQNRCLNPKQANGATPSPVFGIIRMAVEQRSARRSHKPEVVSSNLTRHNLELLARLCVCVRSAVRCSRGKKNSADQRMRTPGDQHIERMIREGSNPALVKRVFSSCFCIPIGIKTLVTGRKDCHYLTGGIG